ncbi:MFS transporter [Sorangium cellulosum]|uniref:MFS transporter n=1 Tax=Sorangium cellulosum TaxID=56 RepID=UPI0003FFE179|nr:MFS transporter [Sorangium cellulosum]
MEPRAARGGAAEQQRLLPGQQRPRILRRSRARGPWPVFAVLVLFGSARAFMMPAQQAILMNLVPADSFGKAVAISSSSFHVAVIVGPTLGGLLYLAGSTIVYAIVAALLLASLLLMGLARATQQARRSEPTSLGAVLEGLRFVGSRPAVLGAISLDLFAVLFGGAVALLPAYARDVLQLGEFESGLTAGWLGLLPAILLGGGATVVVAALWALGFPVLSRMDRFPHAKRDPEESEGRAGEPEAAAAT